MTFDASRDMGLVAKKRAEWTTVTAATKQANADRKDRKRTLNARFAELFATLNDADATAQAMSAEGACDLYDAEHLDAYSDARAGEPAEYLTKLYGA